MFVGLLSLLLLSFVNNIDLCSSLCDYYYDGTPMNGTDYSIPDYDTYNTALSSLSIQSVFTDLFELLLTSDSCWPADSFNDEESYAGLFLRLAWHAAGTFRDTDGKGGAAGGRIRFPPESSWMDNANLDYARALVGGIKEKYGDSLSWGDLFVFAGTAAILQGGGPVGEICAGRVDNTNGSLSDVLNDNSTCNIQGNCTEPLGSAQVGLIYVNAQGYLGIPDPVETAPHVREVFGRMGMNDSEAVALIGGGHAFGKAHGKGCFSNVNYTNSSGVCTSGIEGQWTTYPFEWDNEYFTQLLYGDYNLTIGPGGAYQWENQANGYLMLTTDLAFINDDDYLEIVTEYATDISSLNRAFAAAWSKLVMSGGNMASNYFCVDGSSINISDATTTTTMDMPTTSMDETDDSVFLQTYNLIVLTIFSLFWACL